MTDYTPTTDVFARFVEGLKMGAGMREQAQESALQRMQVQKLQEDLERARRTENLDIQYMSGGNIYSGEDFDKATRVAGLGSLPRYATLEEAVGKNAPLPTGELDIAKVPTKANVQIPADTGAAGLQGYGVPFTQTKEFMDAQPDLMRYQAGLTALSAPAGLNIQTDPSGQQYVPGRKRGDKPTLLPPPANAQIVTLPGSDKQFLSYTTERGQQFTQVQDPNIKVNAITGEMVTLPRGAEFYTPPGAPASLETRTRLTALTKGVDKLETLLAKVPDGRFLGTGAQIINTLTGFFPETRGAKDLGGLLSPMVTRLIGGDVGNLSIVEQQAAKRLTETLPSATKEERAQAIGILRTLIAFRQEANELKLKGWTAQDKEQLATKLTTNLARYGIQSGVPMANGAQATPATQQTGQAKPANRAW